MNKTVKEWLTAYLEKHGTLPDKPVYLDYRCIPSVKKEVVILFDEQGQIKAEEYSLEEHGEVSTDNFYTVVPMLH